MKLIVLFYISINISIFSSCNELRSNTNRNSEINLIYTEKDSIALKDLDLIEFSKFNFFIGAIQGCENQNKIYIIGEEYKYKIGYELFIQFNNEQGIDLTTISDSLKYSNLKSVILKLPKTSKTIIKTESEFDNWEYILPCKSSLFLYENKKLKFIKNYTIYTNDEICNYKRKMLDSLLIE